MNHIIYTILTGGSLVVATIVWLYLLVITARQIMGGDQVDVGTTQ